MVLVLRRWRACLEPRQALLALGAMLVMQGFTLWLGPLASPMVLASRSSLRLARKLPATKFRLVLCELKAAAAGCNMYAIN